MLSGITGSLTLAQVAHIRCGRKHLYKTEGKAMKMAEKRSKAIGEHLVAYKCIDCTGWHIAHERRR